MRSAFVTGSTRGIGRGIAEALRREGWRVFFSGTRKEPPADLPAGADYIPCDISRTEDRQAALEEIPPGKYRR